MMKTVTVLVGLLCTALPAAAQSRLYTNADLGTVQRTHTMTAQELEGLKARQFVYVPARPAPRVHILRTEPSDGPFGKFAPPIPDRRLDGSLWTDPPWMQITYLGHRGYGHGLAPRPMR